MDEVANGQLMLRARYPKVVKVKLCGSEGFDCGSVNVVLPLLRDLTIETFNIEHVHGVTALASLTALRLYIDDNPGGATIINILQNSRSANILEEIVLGSGFQDEGAPRIALARFTELRNTSLNFHFNLGGNQFNQLHNFLRLRILKIRFWYADFTDDGLVNLVEHLPHLQELILHANFTSQLELSEELFERICDVCRGRTQHLVIRDYDQKKKKNEDQILVEPFAAVDTVRFISIRWFSFFQ